MIISNLGKEDIKPDRKVEWTSKIAHIEYTVTGASGGKAITGTLEPSTFAAFTPVGDGPYKVRIEVMSPGRATREVSGLAADDAVAFVFLNPTSFGAETVRVIKNSG